MMTETKIENFDNTGSYVNEQNVNVTGSNVAQGDFIQNNHNYDYFESNPSFASINVDEQENTPVPLFAPQVFELILDKRVLILQGNTHFDQMTFGRAIVHYLVKKNEALSAIELIQNEENKTLINQFQTQDESQVVLLNGIHPRHIQYDLNQLVEIAERKHSYFILNIEHAAKTWTLSVPNCAEYWFEIPDNEVYDHQTLLKWFIGKINQRNLSFFTEDEEVTPTTLISDTKSVEQVVHEIGTPQKLLLFLNNLARSKKIFSDIKANKVITNLQQSQEEITLKWFNNLDVDQQIIAITAALFNGLFCTQYFEILSTMIEKTFWKQQQNTLEALDYCDLNFLLGFFKIEPTEEGDLLIARHNATRIHILKVALHYYPRHIQKALFIFSDIVKLSYKRNQNWELHGTSQKRALLRQVFIESTRDIGLNALINIESIYLDLAASIHAYIQNIAAKSLAQYRLYDKDNLLFETLNKWLHNHSIKKQVDLFLQSGDGKNTETISSIKTTTVRALAYAADYDRPNKLHPEIVEYLTTFARDSNRTIQEAVANVLPKFIIHHTIQLRNEIFDILMPNEIYSEPISSGLMQAYANYPRNTKEVIDHWLSICMTDSSKDNRRYKTTFRDNALISILRTLQKIELSEEGFQLKDLYEIANELLKTEKREAVINANLHLIAYLHQKNYSLAYTQIPNTFARFSRKQRSNMVKYWTLQFIEQRKYLPGGEFTINVINEDFPAWDKLRKRPLTAIEETLFTWLNSNSKIAQKFATLTFLEISRSFENEEFRKMKLYRIEEQKRQVRSAEARRNQEITARQQATPISQRGLGFWLRIKIFFFLLFEDKETKASLKDIIETFIAEPYSKKDLQFVVYKWRVREKGSLSSKLAKWLSKLMTNI